MTDKKYIPKGSMCAVCMFYSDNCSGLSFEKMPVMENIGLVTVVKCTNFVKKAVKINNKDK